MIEQKLQLIFDNKFKNFTSNEGDDYLNFLCSVCESIKIKSQFISLLIPCEKEFIRIKIRSTNQWCVEVPIEFALKIITLGCLP